MGMKTLCTNYFMLRLALLIAPCVIVDRANAACAPASPVNNVTVTCTGATAKGSTVGVLAGAGPDYHVRTNLAVLGARRHRDVRPEPRRQRQRRRLCRVLTSEAGFAQQTRRREDRRAARGEVQ